MNMMEHGQLLINIIIVSFAVYRLAKMITKEDGPFFWFSSWRNKIGQYSQNKGTAVKSLAFLFECPHCFGVYVAAFAVFTYEQLFLFWLILAVAGIQSFIQSIEDLGERYE